MQMIKIPRIALFNADPEQQAAILALFKRHEFSLRLVDNVAAIVALIHDENDGFDAILVPSRLKAGNSPTSICTKLRAESELYDSSILGLNLSADKVMTQGLYHAGADLVLTAPFDAEALYLQLSSLGRQRRVFLESLSSLEQQANAERSLLEAFDFAAEGFLAFGPDFKLKLINSVGTTLLGLSSKPSAEEISRITEQVIPWLKQHQTLLKTRYDISAQKFVSEIEATLTRSDGQLLRGHARIGTLLGDRGEIKLFVLKLKEISQITHLASTLAQSLRTRSLGLLTTAACIRLIESAYLGSGNSVLGSTEDFLNGLPQSSRLNSVLTRLLEFLDLAVSRQISLRVDIKHDALLAVRSTDLAQILGHLILHGAEFVGTAGEVMIQSEGPKPGEGVTILVTATSSKSLPYVNDPYCSALLEGNFSTLLPDAEGKDKLALGLKAAQTIADQYRTAIEYRLASEAVMKIRIKLPIKPEKAGG